MINTIGYFTSSNTIEKENGCYIKYLNFGGKYVPLISCTNPSSNLEAPKPKMQIGHIDSSS